MFKPEGSSSAAGGDFSRNMRALILALAGMLLALVLACTAYFSFSLSLSAGNMTHNPPATIRANNPFELTFEFKAFSGRAEQRYTDVSCHYRLKGEKEYVAIQTSKVATEWNSVTYHADLPPLPTGTSVEYCISSVFDGEQNQTCFAPIPVE
jgi:hypothetical protein